MRSSADGEDDAALVDAPGKRYLDVDRMLPKSEGRIREKVGNGFGGGSTLQ